MYKVISWCDILKTAKYWLISRPGLCFLKALFANYGHKFHLMAELATIVAFGKFPPE